MKPEFLWSPDVGAQQTVRPTVNQVKFGDGYELRVPVGINFKPRSWQVRFTKGPDEAVQILTFLEERGGVEAFTWTDPMNQLGTYVCREWSSVRIGQAGYQITGTFEQVFEY